MICWSSHDNFSFLITLTSAATITDHINEHLLDRICFSVNNLRSTSNTRTSWSDKSYHIKARLSLFIVLVLVLMAKIRWSMDGRAICLSRSWLFYWYDSMMTTIHQSGLISVFPGLSAPSFYWVSSCHVISVCLVKRAIFADVSIPGHKHSLLAMVTTTTRRTLATAPNWISPCSPTQLYMMSCNLKSWMKTLFLQFSGLSA